MINRPLLPLPFLMRVHNYRHGTAPPDAVNIERGTVFGNRFFIGRDGTRSEVIAKYEADLRKRIETDHVLRQQVKDLYPHDLVCGCRPRACHGDPLRKISLELNGVKG